MPYLNKDAILESLTKEDIIKICDNLGCSNYKEDSSGDLCFSTSLCHGGDSPYKLIYYHEPNPNYEDSKGRLFKCYTCGDSFSPIELVIRANRQQGKTITWYKALLYIANITGKTVYSANSIEEKKDIITDFEWINRLKYAKKVHRDAPTLKPINENILDTFSYTPHSFWLDDNITRESLSRYEISYYGLTNQIIIPHRDKDNRLIGIRGRFIDEEDIEMFNGKYMPLLLNNNFLSHNLGSNLYGINVTQDKIKRIKKCILYESEKSCLQNYSYFGEDSYALAVCGSNITKTQISLLVKYLEIEELQIAFDKEYEKADSWEAEAYYNKLIKKVASIVPYTKVTFILDRQGLLNKKDSPSDRGKDVLLKLLDDKILITADEVNRVLEEEHQLKKKK